MSSHPECHPTFAHDPHDPVVRIKQVWKISEWMIYTVQAKCKLCFFLSDHTLKNPDVYVALKVYTTTIRLWTTLIFYTYT